jgi:hypothetical protein
VVLVDLVGGGGDKVLVLAKGSDDGQALQGLSNQADQVTCRSIGGGRRQQQQLIRW